MRTMIFDSGVKIWLSANDTHAWAHKAGAVWPCSELAGKRLFAEFDTNGLLDMAVNGRTSDIPADEFNAITSDHLAEKLPVDHPCHFVAVGQFQ